MANQPTSGGSAVRFEATVHATTRSAELPAVDSLDLDRVPDPEGGVRMLVDPQDLARLVAEGYEVGVQAVAPVAPLDRGLVSDEADVRAYQQPVAGYLCVGRVFTQGPQEQRRHPGQAPAAA